MEDPKDIKPDWKDFLALVIASYQLIMPIVLLILIAGALVIFAIARFMR